MEPLEHERFEDAWQRAFEGAEQAPGEGLWGHIERQLPPERGKRRPVAWVWLAAASLLLTLLAGGLGWWAGRQEIPGAEKRVAVSRPESVPVAPADAKTGLAKSSTSSRQNGTVPTPRVSASGAIQPEVVPPEAVQPRPDAPAGALATVSSSKKTPQARANEVVRPGGFTDPLVATLPRSATRSPRGVATREPVSSRSVSADAGVPAAGKPEIAAPEAVQLPSVTALSVQEQRLLVDFLQNKSAPPFHVAWRIRPPLLPVAKFPVVAPPPAKTPRRPKFWASLGATPVGYNPQVRLSTSLAAVASNANSFYNQASAPGTSTSVAESQAALSYRVGGRMGWQMSSHWSLESGLEYLHGQSTLQSGLVLLNRSNSAATSLLENALGAKSTANGATAGYSLDAISAQNVFVPRDNQLRSTFQYLSVPLQLGYRFWPEKRLEGTLSAGLSGDVFLDNTLQPTNDAFLQPVHYTAADGVYRNLLWSGLAGVGLRYRLDRRWGFSLNGTFRRALASGVRGSSGVQTFPREAGVGLRLDYRF